MSNYVRFRTQTSEGLEPPPSEVVTVRREATPDTTHSDAVAEISLRKNSSRKKHQVFPIELFGQDKLCIPLDRSQTSQSGLPFITKNDDSDMCEYVDWFEITDIPTRGQFVGEMVSSVVKYQRRSTRIEQGDLIRVTGQTNDLWLSGVIESRNQPVIFPVTITEEYQNTYQDTSDKIMVPPRFENENKFDRLLEAAVNFYVKRANWILFVAWIVLIIFLIGIMSLSYVPQQNLQERLQQTVCRIKDYNYQALNQRVTSKNAIEIFVDYEISGASNFQSSQFTARQFCEGMECTQQIYLDRQFLCYYDERVATLVREDNLIQVNSSVTAILGVLALVSALAVLTYLGKCIKFSDFFCPLLYSSSK
eukprot:TRINITY_DN7634_c0_g3_i1.p1 TRINITY_DN7634_c0_g3~~TRINITY_DN7634_c0_g3_i1.p1  ORF type:complete len:364 (-),score=29.57 TRINITY_DN7634_c0_g3_i1:808-1899(-)